jgi:hypothetical protein
MSTAEDELQRERAVKRITDQALLDAVIERELLRTIVRRLVEVAGLRLNGEWLTYAADEYAGRHDFEPEDVAAYQRALEGGET